ncbi:Uncharacterized conserved protein YloU, alkaline shock protein (Asp23) family [Litchfieldia salsa]|uniref:Uncharacterized conserved protein YloU, alkaline shock protein (Asp23) family n=2 Tax=Litchfieldia salsa TaxID=930152 RepID=A0A1H0RGS0_9BACI|nr:Uncharacterized conserved protein YloU, alkaline shock protein (Asp23) family [Litchfieldia salsa]
MGSLYIKEEVLSIISTICINEYEEISTNSTRLKTGFIQKITKKTGISVLENDDGITIQLRLTIISGENIVNTCVHLQKIIMDEILELTGIHVSRVHIIIEDISYRNDI